MKEEEEQLECRSRSTQASLPIRNQQHVPDRNHERIPRHQVHLVLLLLLFLGKSEPVRSGPDVSWKEEVVLFFLYVSEATGSQDGERCGKGHRVGTRTRDGRSED